MLMTIYWNIKKINDGIKESDTKKITEAMDELCRNIPKAHSDPFSKAQSALFTEPASAALCYFLNDIFDNHIELFNDAEFFTRCKRLLKQLNEMWESYQNFGDIVYYYRICCGKLLNMIICGDTEALGLFKAIEKMYDPMCPYSSSHIIVKHYYCMIYAAGKYGNTELLSYIADFMIEIKNRKPRPSLCSCIWFLICALFDSNMYDKIDSIYKEVFDCDPGKMISAYASSAYERRDSIRYMKLIVSEYCKKTEDANKELCSIITANNLLYKFIREDIESHEVKENIYALLEINFTAYNITPIFNYWLKHFPIKGNEETAEEKSIRESVIIGYEKLIEKLAARTPFVCLEYINFFHPQRITKMYEFIERYNVVSLVLCGIYKYDDNPVYSSFCTLSEEFMLPLLEKYNVSLSDMSLTDPINENNGYIKMLIGKKSKIFPALIKKFDPDRDRLAKLIPVCVENHNYDALNEIRKFLANKG